MVDSVCLKWMLRISGDLVVKSNMLRRIVFAALVSISFNKKGLESFIFKDSDINSNIQELQYSWEGEN